MAKIDKFSLGFLGIEFQYRLIKVFVEEPKFFKDLCIIVDQNTFTDPHLKTFVGVLKEYYDKHDAVPSYQMVEIVLRSKAINEIELEYYLSTIQKLKDTTSEGSEEVKDKGRMFFVQQAFIKAANEILKLTAGGLDNIESYNKCINIGENLGKLASSEDFGINIFQNEEEVLSDDYRLPIPTGISRIDEALEGGIGVGELGLIIGPSSFGKVQPYDVNILTPYGFKKMSDIKLGSTITGSDGNPIQVVGVYPHKNWEFHKITFDDGSSTECGLEHLWYVKDNVDNQYKTLPLSDIVNMGYSDLFGGEQFYRFTIPTCSPINFIDGNKLTTINYYEIGRQIGLSKEHSFDENALLHTSQINRNAFLGGIIDSHRFQPIPYQDIQTNGKYNVIYLKNNQYLGLIKNIINSLGGKCFVTIGTDVTVINFNLNTQEGRKIVKIEYSRKSDGQCIKVDALNELYVTDEFIVTHNTSLTTAMASYAASCQTNTNNDKGFTVLQIVFEDKYRQIQRKHFSRLTDTEARNLSKPEFIDGVKEKLKNCKEREFLEKNLIIKKFPTGEVTVTRLKQFIKTLINEGVKPHLVLVDYFECLEMEKGNHGDSEWSREGNTMRKLETMAEELNFACWVTTQGSKDSLVSEFVGMASAGGSVKRIQIPAIIMSISRTMQDIQDNIAAITILKNRSGQAGLRIPQVEFNNGKSIVRTDTVISFENAIDFQSHERKRIAGQTMNVSRDVFASAINKTNPT